MKRPLKSHDGITRRLRAETSTLSGPGGLEIPVYTFDGFVRTISIDDPLRSRTFEAAFPAFHAGEQYYANADLFSGRYRRFAGSDTLSAGSYTSVCRWDGSDLGGLMREIFAYAHPEETDIVLVDDMTDPQDTAGINARYGSRFNPGEYLLVFSAEPQKLVPPEWHERAMVDGKLPNFFAVDCVTERKRLEKVVDLRLPRVQDWFFKIFSDEESLNIHFPLPNMNSFLELLPFLVGQRRGGNSLTQAVGRELRLWGVNGLIYPSARCDAALVVEGGDVVDWYGWNLVDYSKGREPDQEFNPRDGMVVTEMRDFVKNVQQGCYGYFGVPLGQMKIQVSDEAPQLGTWQVVGLEALNFRTWLKRLNPAQRTVLGLPADEDQLGGSEEGLHEVEKLFRNRLRALKLEKGDFGLNEDAVRHLVGRLARRLMDVPFGGMASLGQDKLGELTGAEDQLEAFKAIAIGTGLLVEDPKGYFRFADIRTFEYFTTVG